MGGKHSKTKKNKTFKEIGEKANKEVNNYNHSNTIANVKSLGTINLTNEIIVSKSKSDPGQDYKRLNFLGEGSFAAVYRVQNRITDSIRAMKIINKSSTCSEEDDKEIINEINILRTLDHPNILKIFEFYSNKESYSIVTELCSGGELFQEIVDKGPFSESYSAYVMFQILSAINYCHNMKIIHRDLKPENILITERDKNNYPFIKICDFGTSKMFEKGAIQKKLVGSSYYIAPEVLKKRYDEKCDVWSCGVILYILLSARPPFSGDSDKEIMENVALGKYDLNSSPFDKLSKSCLDLIKHLLIMDPRKRISAQDALAHPWFKEQKSKEIFNRIKDESTLKKLLNNLKSYKRDSIIQETALAYLVHNFPQMKDVVNACKLFNQIDINGDGKINKQELLKGLQSKMKSPSLAKDVDQIYKNIDMDNNGYIEYEEFVRAAVSKEKFLNENILRYAFRYFDKDNSGEITFDEIEEVFKESVSDKTNVHDSLQQIIAEVDANGDGVIDFNEFSNIMKRMLKK
jgi:calcium-dependent protein kinase